MSTVNDLIWRMVVRSFWLRYGRDIRIVGAGAVGLVLLGGYLAARRQPPEEG